MYMYYVFLFQNNSKYLDPFYKMDLDFKIVLDEKSQPTAELRKMDFHFQQLSRKGELLSYNRSNMVHSKYNLNFCDFFLFN